MPLPCARMLQMLLVYCDTRRLLNFGRTSIVRCVILTFSRADCNAGATSFMKYEWKATPALWTSLANILFSFNSSTNCLTSSTGPDTVTDSSELWQAGTIPGGHWARASSQVRPACQKMSRDEPKFWDKEFWVNSVDPDHCRSWSSVCFF